MRTSSNIDGAKAVHATVTPLLLNGGNGTELLTSESDAESENDHHDEAGGDEQLEAVGRQSGLPAFVQVILC